MADFIKAYAITMQNEAGYNPGNGEAETYKGIDRSQNKTWPGWAIIDAVKKTKPKSMNIELAKNLTLQMDIQLFYQKNYWNPLRLSDVHNQSIANAMFDCSVNPCIDTASEVLQKSVNAVKIDHLKVDGNVGPATIAAVNKIDAAGRSKELYDAIKAIRVANYEERVQRTPSMKQWLSGWIKRTGTYNNIA